MTWVDVYICINIFIIGTLFGSFFSLANYRIPRKKDIVKTRSFCPKCNHNLSFFDLIPVISFVFQGGKCRYCKEKISIRYPLLELCTGALFLITYMIFDFSIYFFIALIILIYFIMTTGCYINKQKMLKEELDKLSNESIQNKKAGVFITEVIIAVVILAVTSGSIYMTYKNSNNMSDELNENRARFECIKAAELALGLNYDDLTGFSMSNIIDGIIYNTNVIVSKYSDSYINKEDYIKQLTIKTEYIYNGKSYSYEIETVKKRLS